MLRYRFLGSSSSSGSALLDNMIRRIQMQLGLVGPLKNAIFVSNIAIRSFTSKGLSKFDEQKQSVKEAKRQELLNFGVSYLMNTCGLSLKDAISGSKRLGFKNPQIPDSVLSFLRDHGFTQPQISKVVRKFPKVLSFNAEKTLLPKFEFYYSKGIPRGDLPHILASNPKLIERSLENFLIPTYDFLESVTCLDSKKVVTALKLAFNHHKSSIQKNLVPNIALLRELGVPQRFISFLVINHLCTAYIEHSKFSELVREVKEMGFNPARIVFVQAISVVYKVNKSAWVSRLEVYGRYGWSNEDVLSVFRVNPNWMLVSNEKTAKIMDFVVNKMGWSKEDVSRTPFLTQYSLSRTIRRCYVARILLSKGLVEKDTHLCTFISPPDTYFLERFVKRYLDDVPELLNVYEGKMVPHNDGFKHDKGLSTEVGNRMSRRRS